MEVSEWITALAAELGTAPPTESEVNELLALASIAAHASQRQAAPVSCWIAARAGATAEAALAAARRLAGE